MRDDHRSGSCHDKELTGREFHGGCFRNYVKKLERMEIVASDGELWLSKYGVCRKRKFVSTMKL